MGALTARPSEIISKFMTLMSQSPLKATDWFYQLNRSIEYIQSDSIERNLRWHCSTPYGIMEITINIAKPEKTAVEIELARKAPQNGYPKCLLCPENEGYFGRINHPARQNLRLIPLTLNGEEWFFQYSPYVYYNEHCIVLKNEHTPMNVTPVTFSRLFDFLDYLPHYFIGSNAGLPVVGGSILSHDHYQGGRYVFPLQKAESYKKYMHPKWTEVSVSLIKWPMSVMRLIGKDRFDILSLATHIMRTWTAYTDEDADVYSQTNGTPHNAVTAIARIRSDGMFEFDFVLRNNRTSDEFPLGIFHPHPELHHIKQENIGLIEVMGLAILPARLKSETEKIAKMLSGDMLVEASGELDKHSDWIDYLVNRWGTKNIPSTAEQIIRDEIGIKFTQVLSDAGVFKFTEEGRNQFSRFVESCGMRELANNP
jgi:UDPglucose--hexose-1-phosphate uridylyltransferase